MYPEILHLYGPFSIHSFGLIIALGLLLFVWCANRHPLRKKYMSSDAFIDLVVMGTGCALIGGRLLYVLTHWRMLDHWSEIFNVWQGGLSLLGSVLACGIAVPVYLSYKQIPLLPCLDLIGIHAPLLQGISRMGCFFAGCCYGKVTHRCLFAVHPTQIYSACALIMIFFVLRRIFGCRAMHQGQLFALYLVATSAERFFVDFLRGDQEFYTGAFFDLLSIHQWIALIIFSIGLISFVLMRRTHTYSRPL